MQKGQYNGLREGLGRGLQTGLSKGLARGLANDRSIRFKGHDVIWTLGDSNSRGNSDAVGTTPKYGTVKQFDNSAKNLRTITNTDLLEPVAAGAIGSQWPQAGATYHSLTGRIPVFVNTGIGGSAFFQTTPGFSWYTNDTLFSNATTKLDACLSFMKRKAPDLVIIELGINDVVQGLALDRTYVQSLIDRILSRYPGVRIVMSMPWATNGVLNTYTLLDRCYQIRKWIKMEAVENLTVSLGGDNGVLANWGSGADNLFQGDGFHRTFFGNAFWGDKTFWGICQPQWINKWAKTVTGLYYNRISATRIKWLHDLFDAWDTSGYMDKIDCFNVTSSAGYTDATHRFKNSIIDFGFVAVNSYVDTNLTNIDYDGWHTDGAVSTDRISITPMSLLANYVDFSTDFIRGIHIGSNAVAAGTASIMMGSKESASGGVIYIRQTTANQIQILAASGTALNDTTESRPTSGIYGIGRTGGTQELWKNGVIVNSAAGAAVALSPGANIRSGTVGMYNNNGTLQEFWAGVTGLNFLIENAAINKVTFHSQANSFLTNWLTNVP